MLVLGNYTLMLRSTKCLSLWQCSWVMVKVEGGSGWGLRL